MRILITNHSLDARAGTELAVWELATALRARGHEVAAYSSSHGEVAGLMRAAQVPVIRDPAECPFRPDLIHGQHHLDTMTALLSFPDVPAVYHAHGGLPWAETPPLHPRILHYIAMCPVLAETLTIERNIDPKRMHCVPNWVDLDRFRTVRTPPEKPRRALVYTRMLGPGWFLDQIREGFARHGISLDLAAAQGQGVIRQPESLLPEYDLVLAAGRSALEAIASGCATWVVNWQSSLGLVTTENFESLRAQNLAPFRATPQLDAPLIEHQLAAYRASDVAAVSALVRTTASLNGAADTISDLHRRTLDEWNRGPWPDPASEIAAAANYLRDLHPGLKSLGHLERKTERLEALTRDLKHDATRLRRELKTAAPALALVGALRRTVFGRLALHFAKKRAHPSTGPAPKNAQP